MAALRTAVTPGLLARCFLRQTGKPSRGSRPPSHFWEHRSHIHLVLGGSRLLPGSQLSYRRQRLLWAAIRHNSSQIPPDDGLTAATSVETFSPAADSAAANIVTQTLPEQTYTASPVSSSPPLPAISESASVIVDPTPVVTQPAVNQLADAVPTATDVLEVLAVEPRLAELGLCNYTPVGLIQTLLDFIHMDLGLPWWGAIVAGTVLARVAVFPFIVKGQREAAKLNSILPEITKLNQKMTEAKQSGNKFEFSKAHSELSVFQKKHDVNPFRSFLIPLVQAPIFMSFFIALRKMSYLPVPSMQTGGALWFTDLTLADPYYLLPVVATGSLYLILELGAEGGVDNPNLRTMKTVFRIMPLAILPFTINFPTAIFTYWVTSNVFSLGQVALLKIPAVRQKLNIPEKIQHPPSTMPKTEGFIESLRKGWKNAQQAHQLEERERRIKHRLDHAAKGPLRQTFTHNPLVQAPPIAAASPKGKAAESKVRPWKDTIG